MCSKSKMAAAIVLILALAPVSAVADVINTAACKLGGMRARVDTSTDVISPTASFKTIPATPINFTAGAASNCVLVQFSSVFLATNDNGLHLRAVIDNNIVGSPPQIVVDRPPYDLAHSFTFVFTNISPGSHQLVLQWHNETNFNLLIGPHTTVVQYAP
jgi:hypothetical protein